STSTPPTIRSWRAVPITSMSTRSATPHSSAKPRSASSSRGASSADVDPPVFSRGENVLRDILPPSTLEPAFGRAMFHYLASHLGLKHVASFDSHLGLRHLDRIR